VEEHERMLAMSDINCIKHLRNKKGLSITKIKETLGINWRTAKKYADEDQLPDSKIKQSNGMMYTDKWGYHLKKIKIFNAKTCRTFSARY